MKTTKYVLVIMTLSFASFTTNAFGQIADQPAEINAIYSCKAETDPMKRLACYDAAVGRLEKAQQSGEVVAVSKTQVEKVEREAFGFNIPSLPSLGKLFGGNSKSEKKNRAKDNPLTAPVQTAEIPDAVTKPVTPPVAPPRPEVSKIKEVTLTLRKTTEFGYKKTRFFFTNGQVWEQTDNTRVRVPKVRGGRENTAEISKAALGSFFLKVNGKGASIRVKRVR